MMQTMERCSRRVSFGTKTLPGQLGDLANILKLPDLRHQLNGVVGRLLQHGGYDVPSSEWIQMPGASGGRNARGRPLASNCLP